MIDIEIEPGGGGMPRAGELCTSNARARCRASCRRAGPGAVATMGGEEWLNC